MSGTIISSRLLDFPRCGRVLARTLCVAGFVAMIGLAGATPAEAQRYGINVGCPDVQDLPANASLSQIADLVKPCWSDPGELTCDQLLAMAVPARIDVGDPQAIAANDALQDKCPGVAGGGSNDQPIDSGNYFPDGTYVGLRGYTDLNRGVSSGICKRNYEPFEVRVANGRISFRSGGHRWEGIISGDGFIRIGRDGVSPRPRNPTVIIGNADGAYLFNGYCGTGELRLLR